MSLHTSHRTICLSLLTALLTTTFSVNVYCGAPAPSSASEPIPQAFPRGCEVTGFGYNGTNLVLNETGAQSYYLLQNRASQPIELQRIEDPNDFMSPALVARIQPANWAAFASDVKSLYFQCFFIEASKLPVKIDCREVLDVCQYPRAKFALSNMGNYWVSVDKERRQIIEDSTAKGIYLRW